MESNLEELAVVDSTKTVPNLPILTMPQPSSSLPPRPEFTPFTVPNLCGQPPYDEQDFWTYPSRHNWVVHTRVDDCHPLCPPLEGCCLDGEHQFDAQERTVRPPMFSRADRSPVTASDKAAFLQAWLFFGTLVELTTLCNCSLDVQAEFLVDDGTAVSTEALNGLPARLFSALQPSQIGNEALMERILHLARHVSLFLVEELAEDYDSGTGPLAMHKYTLDECRVLHSISILARIIGLHILLHIYASPPGSIADYDAWAQKRIVQSIDWRGRWAEGMNQLSDSVFDDMVKRGWCVSELFLFDPHELAIASLLSRPRIRKNHDSCTNDLCYALQTDEATYKTAHVDEHCTCDFVDVPTDDLVNILKGGKVPVVMFDAERELRVVCGDDIPYIALSHVCQYESPTVSLSGGCYSDSHSQGLTGWVILKTMHSRSVNFVDYGVTLPISATPSSTIYSTTMIQHATRETRRLELGRHLPQRDVMLAFGWTLSAFRSIPLPNRTEREPSNSWERHSTKRGPC